MATKIFIIIVTMISIVILLSAFAPLHSEKKFWKVICKLRAGMDFVSYWFFNICGILSILVAIYVLAGRIL